MKPFQPVFFSLFLASVFLWTASVTVGRIIHVNPVTPVTAERVYLYDFDGAGAIGTSTAATQALRVYYYYDDIVHIYWRVAPWNWNIYQQIVGSGGDVIKLSAGQLIGPDSSWGSGTLEFQSSDWPTNQRGYAGFRITFDEGANYRYGWMDVARNSSAMTVYQMAFTDLDGQMILAGQIQQPVDLLIVDPNGGELLTGGSTFPILWESSGGPLDAAVLDYSANNGQTWIHIEDANDTGEYAWTVPPVNSHECLVRVSDIIDPNSYDVSNETFIIYTCTLKYDLNYDCKVDAEDLALLATEWLLDGS